MQKNKEEPNFEYLRKLHLENKNIRGENILSVLRVH